MKNIGAIVLISLTAQYISAQDQVTFSSAELQEISVRYSGSVLNWPVLVKLADHDIPNNTFTLTRSDIVQLQSLSDMSYEVDEQQNRLKELIATGAMVFAREELEAANQVLGVYLNHIRDGELEQALQAGIELKPAVDALDAKLSENRVIAVQAQLSKKEGKVDKRLGLLGSWLQAAVGDMLKEADGIKTYEESYASLTFTDGTKIQVSPETEATIRKSRIDKLDDSSDTEITLVDGGILAKLSAAATEKSTYVLNAGPSQSEIRSMNFYAEADGNDKASLSNYDGETVVSMDDVNVTLRKNEGTIVEEGKAPLPPVKLLPAPKIAWASMDTVLYREDVILSWLPVTDATSYHVQYSTEANFDENVSDVNTTSNSVRIENLAEGRTFARVQAIDRLGLKGPYTKSVRIIRNTDSRSPALFVDETTRSIIFTSDNTAVINGTTEPDAKLTVNGFLVAVQPSGSFTWKVSNITREKSVTLKTTDGSGNSTEKTLRVIRLTEADLYRLTANGGRITNDTFYINKQQNITVSGNAYPGLEVFVNNNGDEKRIKTDSQGRWGFTSRMKEGNVSIIFKDAFTGTSYLTKVYTVQAN
ncbi:MAG: hypothetical protein AAFW89_08355 [Bacteroidota bacterium]